jgi:putative membrane protein
VRRFTFYTFWDNTEPEWDRRDVPMIIDSWQSLATATAIFLAVRAVLRPVLMFLTCPLQLITLGLFVFVINALILLFSEEVCDWFNVNFAIDGFFPAFVAALVISAVSFALDRLVRRNMFGPRWT